MSFLSKKYTLTDAAGQVSELDEMLEDLYAQLTRSVLGSGSTEGLEAGDVLYFLDGLQGLADGLLDVLPTVFGLMTADVFDHGRFAVVEVVALAELNGLDGEGLVMVAADLGLGCWWGVIHADSLY